MRVAEFVPPKRFRLLRRIGEGGMGIVYEALVRVEGALPALLGGDEGQAKVQEADAWMRSQAIESPERMSELLAPGFAQT